jgi:hypothetical protein
MAKACRELFVKQNPAQVEVAISATPNIADGASRQEDVMFATFEGRTEVNSHIYGVDATQYWNELCSHYTNDLSEGWTTSSRWIGDPGLYTDCAMHHGEGADYMQPDAFGSAGITSSLNSNPIDEIFPASFSTFEMPQGQSVWPAPYIGQCEESQRHGFSWQEGACWLPTIHVHFHHGFTGLT